MSIRARDLRFLQHSVGKARSRGTTTRIGTWYTGICYPVFRPDTATWPMEARQSGGPVMVLLPVCYGVVETG